MLGEAKEITDDNDRGKSSVHKDLGVREVDHAKNSVDHGVAKGYEDIDETEA